MKDVIWEPYGDYLTRSNVARFMEAHGIRDYEELIRRSTEDIEWFWQAALEDLGVEWYEPYRQVLDVSEGMPWARWFVGGKTNIVHNCLDRHIIGGRGGQLALLWEGDDGARRQLTYAELNAQVCQAANALKELGIGRGDGVGIYLPMSPEVVIALFACLKIGAVAIPVFSGFAAPALALRLRQAGARVLFTANCALRRGKTIPLKKEADAAAALAPSLEHIIVMRRTDAECPWDEGRDVWWDDLFSRQPSHCETERLEAEHRALVLYSSGTTGDPKGTIATHAGCLSQMAKEVGYCLDVKEEDVFFWLTDIGWMMGPWEIIGVCHQGGTVFMYESVPDYPGPARLWEMVERYRINMLGISPTAIRLLMTYGDDPVGKHDLDSLRVLGSTGEPWDTTSYLWYFEKVGKRRCPIMNISGGTELVGCLLAPLPITSLKPCTLRGPGLGMDVDVLDDDGKPVRGGIGHLVCRKPAPSMTKGFLNDPQRYLDTYFSRWPNVWYHGDWARVDEDGFWFLSGRSDDTIKIGGKRLGPAEVEAVLIGHESVAEAAAIGVPHEIKGEALVCFVVLQPRVQPAEDLKEALKSHAAAHIGKALAPEEIHFVPALPKTRSAKILRGTIRRKYLGEPIGDLSTVENPEAVNGIPCRADTLQP